MEHSHQLNQFFIRIAVDLLGQNRNIVLEKIDFILISFNEII